MKTINGKLINQEVNRLDELTQKTERINQRCQSLENQLTVTSKLSNKQYLQKLEEKICFLEELTSSQAHQLLFIKISSFIGLIGLTFILSTKHQPQNTLPQKQTESVRLIKSASINC